jgi:histidyl-tRNA synthetase
MRDFLPEDVRRRDYVVSVIRDVYEGYGFEPVETPAAENLETLLGKYGEEGNKLIFKILKRGEHEVSGQADLALRYDLTVPLARVVAEHHARLPRFFKRYQIQPVWRADRPARGRFREFYQCDIDAIGSKALVVEIELCAAVSDVLRKLGFADFVIRLNHRQVLTALLDLSGFPREQHQDVLIALDKLDKIGEEGVREDLHARGLAPKTVQAFLTLFGNVGRLLEENVGESRKAPQLNQALLLHLQDFVGQHDEGARAVSEMREILELTNATAAAGRVSIDPSLARGLSYYTGAIMEIAAPGSAGSLGGGGRYDNLIGMFLGREVPACGVSLGLERILGLMDERQMFPSDVHEAPAQVMVVLWNAASARDSLELATELRSAGLRVEVYPEPDSVGKQFKYAAKRGVAAVVLVGDDERALRQVAIKSLGTGEQVAVARDRLVETVRLKLAGTGTPSVAVTHDS